MAMIQSEMPVAASELPVGLTDRNHADSRTAAAGWIGRRATLRRILFVAFTLIAIIPVSILALWVESTAFDKEVAEVSERHLLLARNLSHALNRYSLDVEGVFTVAVNEMRTENANTNALSDLLSTMNFEHMCIVASDGTLKTMFTGLSSNGGEDLVTRSMSLRELGTAAAGQVVFSGVQANTWGKPTIYVIQDIGGGDIAVGAMNTGYLQALQKAIAFGERGHSAIVDQHGRVLAHPNENWRLEMKDIAKISAVKRMMAGETGVEKFYSPAMKADMIAGFTRVQRTGWGVMVPQPMTELEARAADVQRLALMIGAVGLFIAMVLSFMLARYIAAPMELVANAAHNVSAGDIDARVASLPKATPNEISAMAVAFNQMLGTLSKRNDQLRDKAEEAETANRAKSRFLANMSHEFRTPLNAIIGYSEIMKDELLGPIGGDGVYSEYSESVNGAGMHLLGLVNEILLLTRAEAGHLEIHPTSTQPGECVEFAVSMVERTTKDSGIQITTAVDADLPTLWTDDGKLRQVLLNLVSNAVKFTDAGGSVTITAKSDSQWACMISVTDTGIGIAPKDMEKVMKPFGQVQDTYSRNHGGTGLGLPLTQELVALMGGVFELSSTPGKGTEAVVKLPEKAPMIELSVSDATTHEETAPVR